MWIQFKVKVTYRKFILEDGREYTSRHWFWGREPVEVFDVWETREEWVGKKKYQKKPHHKKKVKSDKQLAKEAWREHKQFKRDKAKRQDLHGYRSDGCPVWMKRHCNKMHRQWERRCIEREQYDKLGTWNHKRKDIFDPWMWD